MTKSKSWRWLCDADARAVETEGACQPAAPLAVPSPSTLLSPHCHLGESAAAGLQVTRPSSRWRKNICFLAHKLSAVQTTPRARCYPAAPTTTTTTAPPFCPFCQRSAHFSMCLLRRQAASSQDVNRLLYRLCGWEGEAGKTSRVIQTIRQAARVQLCAIFRHNYQWNDVTWVLISAPFWRAAECVQAPASPRARVRLVSEVGVCEPRVSDSRALAPTALRPPPAAPVCVFV